MKAMFVFVASFVLISACGSSDKSASAGAGTTGASTGGDATSTGGNTTSAGTGTTSAGTGGDATSAGGNASSAGGTAAAGASSAGSAGAVVLPPATGAPGVWEEVTPATADPALFTGASGFGMGNIVTDPARPTDLYVGGYGSIWKSTDYGLTWSKLNSNPNPPYEPLGHVLAVAGTTPATLWMANVNGAQHVFKSQDGGLTFTLTGAIPELPDAGNLYSIVVDPHDTTHLISGLHEQDQVVESTDGGDTWKIASGAGWPSGGISWFPFFVDTGDAATTAKTWFAIAQDGASAVMTHDGGKTWAEPKGLEKAQHPHGNSALYQNGKTLFVGGEYATAGAGVFRSTDLGDNWTLVTKGNVGVVWGSPKNVYAMWGWACASCGVKDGGPQPQTAPQPGDTWTMGTVPDGLTWGPNSVASTTDGKHNIFVGSMWATGLWRYVEP